MRQLISGRIYELPTGERIVARSVIDSYYFYSARHGLMLSPKYTARWDGCIMDARTSQPTAWTVDELVDTGESLNA